MDNTEFCNGRVSELEKRPLTLRTFPDSVLCRKSVPVEKFDASLGKFVQDMIAFMKTRGGAGLAAPQVGILQRIVAAVVEDGVLCLVNPRIVRWSGIEAMGEGCLSLPGARYQVCRSTQIYVHARTPEGKERHFNAKGLLARILQHEIDHLDGVLICDKGVPVPETVSKGVS